MNGMTLMGVGATRVVGGSGPATFKRSITIDHTKCGSSDSTNFPVLVSGTYTYLKTTGNGGDVQSSSGYDIFFTSDSAGSTLLSWEQVNWGATTGTVEYWVKVPTVSASTDTVIYIWYGNAATSSFQGGALGSAWNSNFKHVLHVKDGTTLNVTESTSNGNDGTNSGGTAATGQIDGGAGFTAGSKITMVKNLASIIGSSASHSISFWVKFTTHTATDYLVDLDSANSIGAFINIKSGDSVEWGYTSYRSYSSVVTTTGVWYYFAFQKTAAGDNGGLYKNGVLQSSYAGTLGNPNTAASTGSQWGAYHSSGVLCLDGVMDEMRISDVARGADWFLTEYNNQSSPSTFYTVSSPL